MVSSQAAGLTSQLFVISFSLMCHIMTSKREWVVNSQAKGLTSQPLAYLYSDSINCLPDTRETDGK